MNEKFKYYGGLLENPIFRGGGSRKTNKQGGIAQKVGFGQFADLRGGLSKNKGGSVDILKLKKNAWHIPFYKDEKKLILCCSWSSLR